VAGLSAPLKEQASRARSLPGNLGMAEIQNRSSSPRTRGVRAAEQIPLVAAAETAGNGKAAKSRRSEGRGGLYVVRVAGPMVSSPVDEADRHPRGIQQFLFNQRALQRDRKRDEAAQEKPRSNMSASLPAPLRPPLRPRPAPPPPRSRPNRIKRLHQTSRKASRGLR